MRRISGSTFAQPSVKVAKALPSDPQWQYLDLPPLAAVQDRYREESRFRRADTRFYIDPAAAPPPNVICSSRSFAYQHHDMVFDNATRTALYGRPGESQGLLDHMAKADLPLAPMEVPQLHKLILDSGKLAKLDELLTQLKAGGHRVLVYFQMTRMIDLMEEYLAFRQYKYLRLDGSSSISDRRDMVADWQSKPEIFIFLLSTRAGGLGINLTAADTVVFYDSDWNPSNDAQAMDRAHRLGQTRQVTVYRLITKGTIDERILQLARTKKNVQDAVVGSSTEVVGGSAEVGNKEVVSLLLDDDELAETLKQSEARRQKLEARMADNGRKGAASRENKKRAQELAAQAKSANAAASTSRLGGAAAGHGWSMEDEDDDAFGFFSNAKAKPPKGGDEAGEGDDDEEIEAGGEGATTPAAGTTAAAKGKGKAKAPRKPKAPADPADPNAPPKKKRAPAKKKTDEPPETGPDGQPVAKKRGGGGWPKGKPRGKKGAAPVNTVGSVNPFTDQSADNSLAGTPMHLD